MALNQPWDRLPTEHHLAYKGFLFYRDMGPKRTVLDAYRGELGKPLAKQASGTYNRWQKDFRWVERALAYDAHLFDMRKAGEAKAAVAIGFDVARERQKAVRLALEYGELLMQRGKVVLNWPLAERTVRKKVRAASGEEIETEVRYEAVDARNLAAAARIGQIGSEILFAAIHQADVIDAAAESVHAQLTDAETRKAISEAEILWREWEAEHNRKRIDQEARQLPAPPHIANDAEVGP